MNRKETTEFLGRMLKKERFGGMGKYWASEVRRAVRRNGEVLGE